MLRCVKAASPEPRQPFLSLVLGFAAETHAFRSLIVCDL